MQLSRTAGLAGFCCLGETNRLLGGELVTFEERLHIGGRHAVEELIDDALRCVSLDAAIIDQLFDELVERSVPRRGTARREEAAGNDDDPHPSDDMPHSSACHSILRLCPCCR